MKTPGQAAFVEFAKYIDARQLPDYVWITPDHHIRLWNSKPDEYKAEWEAIAQTAIKCQEEHNEQRS